MERRRRYINIFIVFLIACAFATWALGLSNLKYNAESSIAFSGGFPGDTGRWQAAGDWSNVDIGEKRITVHRESEDRSYAKRRVVLPQYPSRVDHQLRVRGVIQTNRQVFNPSDTRGAAYMVWLEDADGEVLKYATIQGLTGDQQFYHAERILNIPNTVSAITLVLNSRDSASSFSLLDASAEIVSITTLYRVLAVSLLAGWLVVGFMAARWLLMHAPPRTAILIGLLAGGIIVGVMMPETVAIPIVEPLFQQLAQWLPLGGTKSGEFTYKIGHFLFFFLTTLVLMLKGKSLHINWTQIACIMVMLAIATEGMQLHLLNRSTQLFDIGVDTVGILLAWIIASVFAYRRNESTGKPRHRRKQRHKHSVNR